MIQINFEIALDKTKRDARILDLLGKENFRRNKTENQKRFKSILKLLLTE